MHAFPLEDKSLVMFRSTKMPTSSCSFLQVFVLIFQVVTPFPYIFTLTLYQIVCELYNDCSITSNTAFQHDSSHFTFYQHHSFLKLIYTVGSHSFVLTRYSTISGQTRVRRDWFAWSVGSDLCNKKLREG